MHAVGPAAQQPERVASLMLELGLAEHAAADRDHGIGCEHESLGEIRVRSDQPAGGLGLGAGQPAHDVAGNLALGHALVDRGRAERVRRDARLLKQLQPARRGRGEHELRPEAARCRARPPRPRRRDRSPFSQARLA